MTDVSNYPSAFILRVKQLKNTWDCQTLKNYNVCGCITELLFAWTVNIRAVL